jgi:Bacterial regulatory proteins, luxR family
VILRSVARGKTNKDIAAQLGISEQGVKVHISRLLERYGAQNRVELVTITKAWPEADGNGSSELSGDIAGIRAGLNKTYQDATDLGETHSGTGQVLAPALPAKTNGHSTNGHLPKVEVDLAAEVRSLRDVLGEINAALKLARELPADADVGPVVDAIRTRVGVALEQSARLDTLVDGERNRDRRSRQGAS